MDRREVIRFLVFRSIGNFLLLFAIFGVFATFGPSLYYEVKFRTIQIRGITFDVPNETSAFGELADQQIPGQQTQTSGPSFGDLLTGRKEISLIPSDIEFSIVIPKIGATSKVIPNVDPSDKSKFLPALQEGVAHAQGSVFPGLPGNIYLFSHSADTFWNVGRYNAIFYLLKDLQAGDEVIIFFQGQRYDYVVTGSRIVDPKDVSFITNAQTGTEQLILQTCWPPGTTWDRLLVFAKPLKSDTEFR